MSKKDFRFWLTFIILIGLSCEAAFYFKHHMQVKHRAVAAQEAAKEHAVELAAGAIGSKKVARQDFPVILSGDGEVAQNNADSTYVDLDFSFPKEQVTELNDGQEVTFVVDELPDVFFKGEIYDLNKEPPSDSDDIDIKAMVDNSEGKLQPGMGALLKIVTDVHQNVQVIPTSALVKKENGNFVYVITDGKAKLTPVTIALEQNDNAEISSGLIDGQDIIVSGTDHIQDGKEVVLENAAHS